MIDAQTLEKKLNTYTHRELIIGSFSAASNVTGIKSDVNQISDLLHRYGAYAFWNYAAAAPYMGIDMNPADKVKNYKDAVFISPHKFIGGSGTPGVLIVKKQLLTNSVPSIPSGGTVMHVTPEDHKFISDHERREEGVTNAPWISVSNSDGFAVNPADQRERWSGFDERQEPIIYCGSGVTASVNLLSRELAALPLGKLYPGSWSE